jgi:hypothetical protein
MPRIQDGGVLDMLTDYLDFIVKIYDQTRLVFADQPNRVYIVYFY